MVAVRHLGFVGQFRPTYKEYLEVFITVQIFFEINAVVSVVRKIEYLAHLA